MEILRINRGDDKGLNLLTKFLDNAGSALLNFRYFNSRSFEVLNNHAYTILLLENGNPIGYGHLDLENEITWLGIAVAEGFQGKGLGKIILKDLINYSIKSGISVIKLSVDKNNNSAINLYEKFGFKLERDLSDTVYLMNLENN